MKTRIYCLAVAFIFVLITASSGEAAMMTPPAEGEQGSAPSVTSPQGQGSPPAAGDQSTTSPAPDQQATTQEGTPLAKEPPPAAGGEQSVTSPAAGQQATSPEGAPLAKEPPPAAAAQGETPSATGPQGAYTATEAQQGSSSLAAEQGVGPLTLKESIGIALQKSPTVQSAQSVIKEAQYRRLSAVSDFLPQVNMQYTYTRRDRAPIIVIPPNPPRAIGTTDNYNWSTSVSQPVFTGGALINSYLLAKIGVDSAKVTLEQTKRDLVLQVKVAYYAVLTAEKGVEVAQQAVQQVESHYTVAKAFFEVGITAKNDVLQVEVELAQTRQNLIAAEHNLEVARAVFNTLMRRDINEPVRLGEALEYTPLTINMNALYDEALRERPEIKLSDLGIQSAKKEVGIAASKLFPQLSIVYTYERQGDDPSVEGSRFTRMHDWNVMGVAQWTVWDWGKAWWGVGESKARVFQAECALQQVKDAVILDVQAAALKVDEAKKNIQVADTAVSQAEEDSRINEERFKGQVGTTTDVLDSLTRLTQARTNYYSALSDYNVAKARLQRAIGSM